MRTYRKVPWTYKASLDAVALRRAGMSYADIAIALQHFHGFRPSNEAVRHLCRSAGCPPRGGGYRVSNLPARAA